MPARVAQKVARQYSSIPWPSLPLTTDAATHHSGDCVPREEGESHYWLLEEAEYATGRAAVSLSGGRAATMSRCAASTLSSTCEHRRIIFDAFAFSAAELTSDATALDFESGWCGSRTRLRLPRLRDQFCYSAEQPRHGQTQA